VGGLGGVHGFRWERSKLPDQREAKEEKKREKLSKNRIEWILPSVACLQSNFCVTHIFYFFSFPLFFSRFLHSQKRWQLVGGGTQREKKRKGKKERHALTDMIPTTIQSLPFSKIQTYEIAQFYCPCE